MQGLRYPDHWKWNQTLGSLEDRPGHPGVWGDVNTDGLGLLEQMQMARDLDLTVVLGLHARLCLNGDLIAEDRNSHVHGHGYGRARISECKSISINAMFLGMGL